MLTGNVFTFSPITVIKDSCARGLSFPTSQSRLLDKLPYMQYDTCRKTDLGFSALDNDL